MSSPRSASRVSPALVALALLLGACASPGPPTPGVQLTARKDPYVVGPATGYSLAAAGAAAQRVEAAFEALSVGRDLADVETAGRDVLQETPEYRPAAVLLAQVEYLRRDDAAATRLLRPWVEELPDYTAAQLLLGRLAERAGDLPVALEAFSRIAEDNRQAADRAEQVRPRAVEMVSALLRDEIARRRLENAEAHLAWLEEWVGGSRETLEATRLVAIEKGDLETELEVVRRLSTETGERSFRQREAELEVELGDVRAGLAKLEVLAGEFPEDAELATALEQAEFLWRLQLLPEDVLAIGNKPELDRAEVATLLYWLVPRVRYSQISNPPIAADILDHPQRDVILRVLDLGLMEVDETLHRFEPTATASRIVVLRAQLALLSSSPQRRTCLADVRALELDRSWSTLCRLAAGCRLIPEAADCRPAASISGAEAVELFRKTLNLLGSGG